MNFLKRFSVLSVMMLVAVTMMAQELPKVYILATGGTIAGSGSSATKSNYSAGQVAIGTLLDAVPAINDVAYVEGEQVVNIGSQDMSDDVWLVLAKRVNELIASQKVNGIVITHGTDTMEETAFFLSLVTDSNIPIVLVGAMRPSTAISADGPVNLYNAVVTAASPASMGRGVLVCMNGKVYGAADVTKTNTTSVETFQSPNSGALGYIHNGEVFYYHAPDRVGRKFVDHVHEGTLFNEVRTPYFNIDGLKSLPKVGIAYGYSSVEGDVVDMMIDKHYKGIVYAGVGNGNIHKNVFPELEKARKDGIIVVRSSRVPTGATTLDAEVDDNKYEFVASWGLNPQKARILLMLALTKTDDWKTIQKYFNNY
ncbi:MAG: L-asparaginase 2 [Bacteroidaceae bacterium]|nr:L-asparaginase 2 [Bacteroidaceae bacterium]